jgi:cytochrome c2
MSAIRPSCLFALAAQMATPATHADGLKGDAAAGKALFMSSSCPTCHAGTKKSLLGPSENMKKYGVIWSAETLDEFLTNPSAKVPGTPMAGILPDPQQRADVIVFLSTLKE